MNGSNLAEKVRLALEQLPQGTIDTISYAVSAAKQNGQNDPLFDMLNEALRSLKSTRPPQRQHTHLSRFFFAPLEEFLIDERPHQKTSGRVRRGALQQIWNWIENNIAEEKIRPFRHRLQNDDFDRSEILQKFENEFLNAVLPQLQDMLARAHETPETRRRFAYYLGGEPYLLELEDIVAILTHRETIASFKKNFPAQPSLNSPSDLARVSRVFTKFAEIEPRLPYYASTVLQKLLDHKTQLPLWAANCSGTDDLREIANSPFAAMIETSLGDASLAAEQCLAELKKPSEGNAAIHFVQDYALTCRNLRAAVDFEAQNSDWLRRLSETRLRISTALAEELGQLFQLMRRNVRPLRAFGSQNPYPPDEFDIGRLCFLINLLMTVRFYIEEFALNEIASRIHTECENYLQLAIDSLQDDLRVHHDSKRRIVLAYAQAALRVSEAWYGKEHAALLKRSFEAAGQPPQKASA